MGGKLWDSIRQEKAYMINTFPLRFALAENTQAANCLIWHASNSSEFGAFVKYPLCCSFHGDRMTSIDIGLFSCIQERITVSLVQIF